MDYAQCVLQFLANGWERGVSWLATRGRRSLFLVSVMRTRVAEQQRFEEAAEYDLQLHSSLLYRVIYLPKAHFCA
jgi:hypothetical protein